MFGGNDANDKTLLKNVTQKLARGGTGSQCRVNASVAQGNVTLSGTLQYEAQRAPLLKLIARISGVRRVIDQLRLIPKKVYPVSAQARPTVAQAVATEPVPEIETATPNDAPEAATA